MNIFSELLEGGTPQMQKKKRITFYLLCVTAALIVIMLVVLAIYGIAVLLSQNRSLENDLDKANIGNTTVTTISEDNLHSGSLLILNESNRFGGTPSLVNLQERKDRPKTDTGTNAYSIRPLTRENFMATDAAATALNKMLGAFYKVMKDDNIIISNAYDMSKADTQDAVYSSGESFEFTYFYDAEVSTADTRNIYGVQTYNWIYNNAYKYGFVVIGESEPNVFRFVGTVHSTAIKQSGLSFDEYLESLKTKTPAEPLRVNASGSIFAVYYLAKDGEHTIPESYEYTVSGNNVDGYIITVNLSKKATN